MSEWDKDASEHDPAVSAIYRNAGDLAPHTSLDDAILAKAKRAVRQRRQRWMLPLSTAAVLMVSVTLLLNMNEEWDISRERVGSPISQSLPAAPRSESVMAEKPKPALPATPRETVVEEELERMAPAEIAAAEPAPSAPLPVEAKAKRAAPSSLDLTADTAHLSKGAPAPSEELEQGARSRAESAGVLAFSDNFSAQADLAEEEAAKKKENVANPSTEPQMGVTKQPGNQDVVVHTENDVQDVLEPKPWLAKIRDLVKAGNSAAARKELESFTKRYPDYILPDDLKSL